MKPVQLARRMAALGFPWHPQTVSNVESGRRRITAEELLPLALCLQVPVPRLLIPADSDSIVDIEPRNARVDDPEPGGAERLLPASVAAEWIGGYGDTGFWLEWDDGDRPLWPTMAQLEERLELDRRVHAADAARDNANAEISVAVERQARAAATGAETPQSLQAKEAVRRAGAAAQDAVDAYMAAVAAVQQHRVQVREALIKRAAARSRREESEG